MNEFEKWASAPPYERNLRKYVGPGVYAWPGQYIDYATQLAFEAWNHQQAKLDEKDKEIDRLRNVLGEYANIYNWNKDYKGIRRVWLEPGSATPEAYNGFEMARAAILNDESGQAKLDERDEDISECDRIISKLSELLEKTAIAIRGEPPELTKYSFHDIPDRASACISIIGLQQTIIHEMDKEIEALRGFSMKMHIQFNAEYSINSACSTDARYVEEKPQQSKLESILESIKSMQIEDFRKIDVTGLTKEETAQINAACKTRKKQIIDSQVVSTQEKQPETIETRIENCKTVEDYNNLIATLSPDEAEKHLDDIYFRMDMLRDSQ